jgi:hypothetical protein
MNLKYAIVTVAHRQDFGFMRLQARSLRLKLPRDLVDEIVIVENPTPGQPTDWRDSLRHEFGDAASLVRFVEAHEIADIAPSTPGWFAQQILKLMVSRIVTADRYLVIDAKNHLVLPLTRDFLECGARLRSRVYSYERHPFRVGVENAVRYFGMEPAEHIERFLPASVPYALPTSVVRELVSEVTEREQRPFPLVFLDIRTTEFLLFGAFITGGRRVDELYDLSGVHCSVVWKNSALCGGGEIEELIARTERSALPFFAVHRAALSELRDEARWTIATFWHRHGLFASAADGYRFLLDPNAADA